MIYGQIQIPHIAVLGIYRNDTIDIYEMKNRLEKLEKYFEKIKKVMPWVPDENGEYK